MAQWEAAVRFQPGLAEAHDKLGVARWQSGRKAEAMEEWRPGGAKASPGYADAHFHLGARPWNKWAGYRKRLRNTNKHWF